jgi:hypothetical protein
MEMAGVAAAGNRAGTGALGRKMSGWWARQDLNLGPTDYESAALTAELRAPLYCNILHREGLARTCDMRPFPINSPGA